MRHAYFDLVLKRVGFVADQEGRALIAGYEVDGERLFFVAGEGKEN